MNKPHNSIVGKVTIGFTHSNLSFFLVAILIVIAQLQRSLFGAFWGEFGFDFVEIVALSIAALLAISRVGTKSKPNNNYLLPEKMLILFGLALTVNMLFSCAVPVFHQYDTLEAFILWHRYLASIVLPYFLIRGAMLATLASEKLFCLALVVSLVMSIIVISGVAETNMLGFDASNEAVGQVRLPASFSLSVGGNTMALYLLIPLFAGYAIWLSFNSQKKRYLGLLLFVTAASATVFLSTRAVILISPLGFAIITFINLRKRSVDIKAPRSYRYFWLVLFLIVVIATVYVKGEELVSFLPEYQAVKIGSIYSGDINVSGNNTILTRFLQYPAYQEVISINPLGYGLSTHYPEYYIQPHGLLLGLLLRSGWLGFLCYLSFIIGITRYWYRSLPYVSPKVRSYLVAMITLNLVLMAISWGYDFMNRFGIQLTYFMLCGLATAMARNTIIGRKKALCLQQYRM